MKEIVKLEEMLKKAGIPCSGYMQYVPSGNHISYLIYPEYGNSVFSVSQNYNMGKMQGYMYGDNIGEVTAKQAFSIIQKMAI